MHSLPLFYIFNSFLHFSSECSIFCVRGVMENDSVKEGSSIPIFMDFNPLKSLNRSLLQGHGSFGSVDTHEKQCFLSTAVWFVIQWRPAKTLLMPSSSFVYLNAF